MSIVRNVGAIVPRPLLLQVKYFVHFAKRAIHGYNKYSTTCPLQSLKKKKTHVFFGYYDVSPFNPNSDEIVYLNLKKGANHVDIYISNINNLCHETLIDSSYAWNWQQGIRLRWMPNDNREICFNDFRDNEYIARIINVDSKKERTICKPLYDISPDGSIGLSLDFERLGVKRPGYGYTCRNYSESNRNLEEEGIDIVDLINNTHRRILDYSTISHVAGTNCNCFKDNYINHIAFSPNGDKFLFFWLTVTDQCHRADLLVYDIRKQTLVLLENKDRVSHYVWLDNNRILCTAYNDENKCYYYIYDQVEQSKKIVNPQVLNEDGHPCMFSDNTILTDTYPDHNGFQKLYLAGFSEGGYNPLISIYSNCRIEGERRTDLHPRLNLSKKMVCFDSNQDKYRTLNLLDIGDYLHD